MRKKIMLALALVLALAVSSQAQVTVPHVFTTSVPVSQLNTDLSTLGAGALNRTGGTITGTITVNSGVTIDGVDISAVLGGTGTPTFSTLTLSSTSASALDVAGGINAGSGNVGIVDATGKIPAISSTYFSSLSGANLTGISASTSITFPSWTAVSYSSGNFVGVAPLSWTVDSGDMGTNSYFKLGTAMWWSLGVNSTTLSGSAAGEIRVTIPGSFTVGSSTNGSCNMRNNSTDQEGMWTAIAGNTYVSIYRGPIAGNYTLETDAFSLRCFIVVSTTT